MLLLILFVIVTLSFCKNEIVRNNERRINSEFSNDWAQIVSRSHGSGTITNPPSSLTYKNLYGYGIMFDLYAMKTVAISEFNVYATKGKKVYYHAYTVEGSYKNSKTDLSSWDMIKSGYVFGQGSSEAIPIKGMKSVIIKPTVHQGFYITLTTEDLIYSTTIKKLGNRLVWNNEVSVDVGSSVSSYPLGFTFYEPRIWCGSVKYYIMDAPETTAPSASPSITLSNKPSISVQPSSLPSQMPSFSFSPTLFPSTIEPTSLPTSTLHKISTDQMFIFYGADLDFMDKITEETFTNMLQTYYMSPLSKVSPELQVSVKVTDEYVIDNIIVELSTVVTLMYRTPQENALSNHDYSSIVQDVFTIEKSNKFLSELQSGNDSSYFRHIKQISSLKAPDNYYEYENHIVNQTIFCQGHSFLQIMDIESKINFETTIRKFLNHTLFDINPTTKFVTVYVTRQIFIPPINNSLPLLKTWTFIQGKFLPPPNYDFKSQIESSIDKYHDLLKGKLRATRMAMFQDITKIHSSCPNPICVQKNQILESDLPKNVVLDTFETSKTFVKKYRIYIIIGVVGLVILLILVKFIKSCCCVRDKVSIQQYEPVRKHSTLAHLEPTIRRQASERIIRRPSSLLINYNPDKPRRHSTLSTNYDPALVVG